MWSRAATIALWVSMAGLGATTSPAQTKDHARELQELEQRIARAWVGRDRAFLERVLTPEWSVTQADGQILTRADVLGSFFDAVKLETCVTDDVSVTLFGTTAIVRGRTTAAGTYEGRPVSARIRFTDVFLERGGRWQAIASHASPLPAQPGRQ